MANISSIDTVRNVFSSARGATAEESASSQDSGSEEAPPATTENTSSEQRGVGIGEREDLRQGAELLNDMANTLNRDIEFEVAGPDGLVQARIMNKDTGEEIRSIPPDEVILVKKKIDAFLGLFVDETR